MGNTSLSLFFISLFLSSLFLFPSIRTNKQAEKVRERHTEREGLPLLQREREKERKTERESNAEGTSNHSHITREWKRKYKFISMYVYADRLSVTFNQIDVHIRILL